MKVAFRPAAEFELSEIVGWYSRYAPEIVDRLEEELGELVAILARKPREFPVKYRTVRQALFRSLPYRLFFVIKRRSVEVLAVRHQSRDPQRCAQRPPRQRSGVVSPKQRHRLLLWAEV